MGQTTHNVEEDGYGSGMLPMHPQNILPVLYGQASGTITRSEWTTWTFDSKYPKIVPYLHLPFWLGIGTQNNTQTFFNNVMAVSRGVTWHKFTMELYLQAVTRERLLVQGATSYKTYDFETSQNLQLNWVNNYDMRVTFKDKELNNTLHQSTNIDLQDNLDPPYHIEELATGHKKTITWTMPQTPPGKAYKPITIQQAGNNEYFKALIPAIQESNYENDQNIAIVTNGKHKYAVWLKDNHMSALLIDQPHINNETDIMKFQYRVLIKKTADWTAHLKPSNTDNTSYLVSQIPYPQAPFTQVGEEYTLESYYRANY